jgi:hypothetical protein
MRNLVGGQPRHVVIEPERTWAWPSFGWGVVGGFYVGCLFTVGLAYLWSFYL